MGQSMCCKVGLHKRCGGIVEHWIGDWDGLLDMLRCRKCKKEEIICGKVKIRKDKPTWIEFHKPKSAGLTIQEIVHGSTYESSIIHRWAYGINHYQDVCMRKLLGSDKR